MIRREGGTGEHLLLVLGVFACSTAVIMIKSSNTHPVMLAGWRLVLAALLLTPAMLRARSADPRPWGALFSRAWVGALLLAAHFVSWAAGARMTVAANASLVVNLVPVAMPVLAYLMLGERISRREVVGTCLSLSGVAVLTLGVVGFGGDTLAGDLTCFGSMVLVTAYLVVSRVRNDGTSLWLYVVPLYWIAGLSCLAVGLVWPGPARWLPAGWAEWGWLLALAAIPTIVGHSLLNRAMRRLRSQVVSVANLGQFAFAGGLGFAIFGEVPSVRFYLAGALVLCGAALVVTERKNQVAKVRAAAMSEE